MLQKNLFRWIFSVSLVDERLSIKYYEWYRKRQMFLFKCNPAARTDSILKYDNAFWSLFPCTSLWSAFSEEAASLLVTHLFLFHCLHLKSQFPLRECTKLVASSDDCDGINRNDDLMWGIIVKKQGCGFQVNSSADENEQNRSQSMCSARAGWPQSWAASLPQSVSDWRQSVLMVCIAVIVAKYVYYHHIYIEGVCVCILNYKE